jgi:2,4-dienoyl-CoA reductase-like NADH-dependent reductase (Old Yellow Enzyme family)
MGLWRAEHAQAFKPITDFIRAMGAVPAAQISHCGRRGATTAPWDGKRPLIPADAERGQPPWELWAPSAIACHPDAQVPRELDRAMIEQVQNEYVQAVRLAIDAGFDALELHGGHGYLLHSFLSPLSNRRSDGYGGSRANRMRFVLEVVDRVRRAWPQDRPLFFRISAFDGVSGGWDVDDSVILVHELVQRGVDVVDVSSGGLGGTSSNAAPHTRTPGYHVPIAARIREATGALTQVVGLITDATQADAVIRNGSADLIAIAREALRNPFWAAHASEALGTTQFRAWPEQYAWWLRARASHLGKSA